MPMEAKKSHNLSSASWRTRNAVYNSVKGLKKQEATEVSLRIWRPESQEFQCPRQKNVNIQFKKRVEIYSYMKFLF